MSFISFSSLLALRNLPFLISVHSSEENDNILSEARVRLQGLSRSRTRPSQACHRQHGGEPESPGVPRAPSSPSKAARYRTAPATATETAISSSPTTTTATTTASPATAAAIPTARTSTRPGVPSDVHSLYPARLV